MPTKCPKCQLENPETSRFCADCGTQLMNSKDVRAEVTETLQIPIHELTSGSTFAGRYQIIEELGKGGMGKAYRVLDKKLNEEVALKLIKPEIASDRRTLERFSNELKIARKIVHKNVGRMYHLSDERGTYYITMEYVPGENLKSSIRRFGPLPIGKTIALAEQICEGLAEAHKLGIAHRDLKPSNIMIDGEGNARIMDFGIARSLHAESITGEGVIIGTPEYMSPEQVEGQGVGERSDIYSLGVILYEMVTGRVPFSGDTPLSVAVKQKTEVPQDPGQLNAQVPESLSGIILKCLEKDKAKRYQSAEELHSELTRIAEEIPTAERAISKKKPTKSREIRAKKGKIEWAKIALYGGAVALLALILYAGLHLFTGRKEVIDSIAVLPFENVNADPDTGYLCDGITETIINKLAQVSGFNKVINRTSVFTYKGKAVDPKTVGRELGVSTVLVTRMVRIGDRLTISPTLVLAKDNSQIWGERYDRKFVEILSIEDDIATSIVEALRLKLTRQEQQKIAERPIDNPAAYELYLKAYSAIWTFREEALDRIVQDLQNALDITGPNPLLYSSMAEAYRQYVNIGARQEDYLAKAEDYARKALALDPGSSKANVALGYLTEYRDQQEGIRYFKKALAANPNEADALRRFALIYYLDVGRPSEALSLMERLKKTDPLNPANHLLQGIFSYCEGQFGLALDSLRKWYRSDPENPIRRFHYALMLAYNKAIDEAFLIIDQSAKATPNNVVTKFGLLLKYGLLKDREKAFLIMTPDFRKTCQRDSEWAYYVADFFALLDEKKEALDWLENAVDRGVINYPFINKHDIFLDNIRGEERFQKLMERVKYEWEHFEE
ncbi:MAG: protein kinase [Clostridiales bacterium]|nr:protein kinase [Clostridiales bacterium]